MNLPYTILRKPEILNLLKICKSNLHCKINAGLLPPPISLGTRAVGFIQHEYNEVICAMIAGYSDPEIKELVKKLVSKRQSFTDKGEN